MDNTAILREWLDRVDSDRTGNITAAQLKSTLAIGNLDFPLSVVQQMIRMYDFDRNVQTLCGYYAIAYLADTLLRGYYGWNSRRAVQVLDRVFPKADILLRGYYGWNSRRAVQVLDRVFPKDAATQPSLVIVYFGGNDSMGAHSSGLGPHVPLPEYVENMRKIALHLKSLSDSIRIIFLSCPPVDEVRVGQGASGIFSELVRTNDLCKSYSEACKELCHELDVKVVDLFTAIQQRDEWKTACFTDGVHLSAEGSKVVAAEILKVLKEAEWEPSLHWKSMPTEFAENSAYDLVAADGKTTLNPSDWTFHREIQWD